MAKEYRYKTTIIWTGNKGLGTKGYDTYERNYTISIEGKAEILASSDPSFLGDSSRHNPEELLVASLSSCHMLWYLHLCATEGIIVLDYCDKASGIMEENPENGGQFKEVTLRPTVIITNAMLIDKANELHKKANKMCFIANSCNFPVRHIASCKVQVR